MGRYKIKRKLSEETKRKIGKSNRLKLSDESIKQKMRDAKIGFIPWNKGKIGVYSEETIQKYKDAKLGDKNPFHGTGINLGKKFNENWKNKISKSLKNRKLSDEHTRKIKEAFVKYKKDSGKWHNIGKNEKSILDNQEKISGYKIERQYQIGIYIVDGYCKKTNTVYEIYEKKHEKQLQSDLNRETEICNKLSCDFIILWDY